MSDVTHWEQLRERVCSAAGLYRLAVTGCCVVCHGPVSSGYRRCYQCEGHARTGAGLLADLVIPLCYGMTRTPFGHELWDYKAGRSSGSTLLALLLTFLHDHAACVWPPSRQPAPLRLAVVPSGSGRAEVHPLLRLVSPYLTLPVVPVTLRPGNQGRHVDPARFRAGPEAAGARMLLLDDTWVSGASAQSAAISLKSAGATEVVTVVLARLLLAGRPQALALAGERYDPATCAIHETSLVKAGPYPLSGNTLGLAAR